MVIDRQGNRLKPAAETIFFAEIKLDRVVKCSHFCVKILQKKIYCRLSMFLSCLTKPHDFFLSPLWSTCSPTELQWPCKSKFGYWPAKNTAMDLVRMHSLNFFSLLPNYLDASLPAMPLLHDRYFSCIFNIETRVVLLRTLKAVKKGFGIGFKNIFLEARK